MTGLLVAIAFLVFSGLVALARVVFRRWVMP